MAGKRIILMYISEVSGHHSATIAIEKALKIMAPDTEVLNINAFNYTNPISERIVNRLYMGVIKTTPQIWDFLYDNPAVVKRLDTIKKTIHKFNSPKFQKLFDKFRPDVVACAQAFPCGMVADFKASTGSSLPLVAILTDYIPHAYWIYDTVDYYIAPSDEMADRLVQRGVPFEKIQTFGIPFDNKFNVHVDKREVIRRLGLVPGMPTLLIMGGGQGLGPIKAIVKSLDKAETEMQVLIVTGTNKKLYKSLKKQVKKHRKNLHIYGYVNNINELMTISDAVVTKPGGITTAEALSKHLPMLIIKPIPGQEMNNTTFLTDKGAAVRLEEPKEIHLLVDALFKYPETLQRLRTSASRICKPHASMDIARLLLRLCNG